MSIDAKLNEEIERELDAIYKMEVGSDEHSAAVDHVTKLMDRVIEMQRLDGEEQSKSEDRKAEQKNRLIGHIITGGIGLGTLLVTIWGTKKSFKFEEVGTITTQAGRAFLSRVFAKK
jgi:ferric-dicitrate binding protein FerR (iron transport regulator)